MEEILSKVERLVLLYDQISPEVISEKNVKLGLRNADGSGVIVGITTKGRVIGYDTVKDKKKPTGQKVVPVEGKLYYCGYDVSEIVKYNEENRIFGFEEIIYLLIVGELPNSDDLGKFKKMLHKRAKLSNAERTIVISEVENRNQMYALHSVISHLSRCDNNPDSTGVLEVSKRSIDLIAKAPMIVAHNYNAYRFFKGEDLSFARPKNNLSIAENFLYMLKGKIPDKDEALIFDACLILHAEHGGGNNSTFTVRTVSSSGANTYMAMAAGIASLSGQFHGGANESVMSMMRQCQKEVKDWTNEQEIKKFLQKVLAGKAGDNSGKIYGLGHAVYTLSDPRAIILKRYAKMLAEKYDRMELFDLFDKVEKIGKDIIFEKKGFQICANVDFYSGLVYYFLGIPEILYTPIFAMARMVGWSAHRLEQIVQGKIIRPAYISPDYEIYKYPDISERDY